MPRRFRRRRMRRGRRFIRRSRRFRRGRKSFRGRRGGRGGYKSLFAKGGSISRVSRRKLSKAEYKDPVNLAYAFPGGGTVATGVTYQVNTLLNILAGVTALIPGLGEMCQYYQSYRITSARIRTLFCNVNAYPMFVMVGYSALSGGTSISTSTTLSTAKRIAQNPGFKMKMLNPLGSPGSTKMITQYIKFRKHFGDMYISAEAEYTGSIIAGSPTNPANGVYGSVFMWRYDGTNAISGNVVVDTRVTLYGHFFEAQTELN